MLRTLASLLLLSAIFLPLAAQENAKKAEPFVQIVHVASGKILAVDNDSEESAAVTVVVKEDKEKAAPRQWQLVKDGEFVKVVHRTSSKVLDVNEDSRDEGAAIIIYDAKDEGTDNQRWSWVGKGDERRLKSKSSELVLTINEDGKVIQKKADEKDKKQLWKVVEVKK